MGNGVASELGAFRVVQLLRRRGHGPTLRLHAVHDSEQRRRVVAEVVRMDTVFSRWQSKRWRPHSN
eukprot:CAMPEP_0171713026 /NCGR_PEP_ID=MMETSP0991-20121206/17505_1 /TAXON_ID=483369 /ORGANISM="non described non described, Strain CCMP2098" /LENGTH=65 /DNA_ID=CAMNT_0012303599 /DNA_START=284 /DNA_END=481 /DNA_ORIENTATION=-